MNSHFLTGFADELVKTAANPIAAGLKKAKKLSKPGLTNELKHELGKVLGVHPTEVEGILHTAPHLLKEGSAFGKIREGATLLGQKVRSITNSVVKRARGIRDESKGGTGLKGVTTPKGIKTAADLLAGIKLADEADGDGEGDGDANDVLKALIQEAEARINDSSNEQGYNEQQSDGADDPSYGAGQGLPKKKPAKPMKRPMI